MSVHGTIGVKAGWSEDCDTTATLPDRVKLDRTAVHVAIVRRLAAHGAMFRGAATGALKRHGQGRVMRLDLRQRVVVKAMVARHLGARRGAALARHVSYLSRSGAGQNGERGEFYDLQNEGLDGRAVTSGWSEDRHHFRFIISPEHGDRIADLTGYVRTVMSRMAEDLREPQLAWTAVNHFDTDQPHAHVLVRGRREDGRDLVIPRSYMGHGLRGRAQDAAQELLGDLTRDEAERRVWRETTADRFTRFDRALLAEAAANGGVVQSGVDRAGSYAALLRARIGRLQALGLAQAVAGGVRLSPRLEPELRALSIRNDIIRTLNQRRLEGTARVRELEHASVRGKVVRAGFHDELGAQGYLVVRAASGDEYYARLRMGAAVPETGADVQVSPAGRGLASVRRIGRELGRQV